MSPDEKRSVRDLIMEKAAWFGKQAELALTKENKEHYGKMRAKYIRLAGKI